MPKQNIETQRKKDKASLRNERSKKLPEAANLLSFRMNKLDVDNRIWERENTV